MKYDILLYTYPRMDCGPRILLNAFPLDDETCFFICLVKNMIFRKDLESPLIFVLFFLRENKIRKKTLSVTPYLEKMVCEKPKSGFRGQVTYCESTIKTVTPL